MNHKLFFRSAAMSILVGVMTVSIASADELYCPYVGVGFQMLNLNLNRAYGNPFFKKKVPGGTVFVGFRVGDFLGIEAGYHYFSLNKSRIVNRRERFPGTDQSLAEVYGNTISWVDFSTRTLIHELNLGVTGYLPLANMASMLCNTELFTTVGISRSSFRMRFQAERGLGTDRRFIIPIPAQNLIKYTFKKKKTIPMVRVGLQQKLTDYIDISLFSEWKRLNVFKIKNLALATELRLKNTVSYGLRIGYVF